ncbi:MAG: DUF362 domain-containing protein [Desulfobacterales bacterium]
MDWLLPEMAVVRQSLVSREIADVPAAFAAAMAPTEKALGSGNGASVAVCVGSRNISHLDTLVFQCLRFLEDKGFSPFIVPAMGSHGGATSEGQTAVLAGFNITESTMQAPIAAEMKTRPIASPGTDLPLYVSTAALDADYIVPINRIKSHTKFSRAIESGLCKMLTIGLGKADGAAAFHRAAVTHGFGIIEQAAAQFLKKLNFLFGVGVLEDGYSRLSHIEALMPEAMIDREKELLLQARQMMAAIPFDPIDVLIVDQIGKDISGIGMDANVTGRHRDIAGDFYSAPHVKRIFVRGLSPASGGNANGIGLADVTTRRLAAAVDWQKTFVNAVTAISPEKAALPMHFETDRECLTACAKTTGVAEMPDLRIVRIKHTASLSYLHVSRPLESEIQANPALSRIGDWAPPAFDANSNLKDFIPDE